MKLLISSILLSLVPIYAQEAGAVKPNPAFVEVQDAPGLPRVLIIGDSISIGYTLPLRTLLDGKANVHRILTNGGPSLNGLRNLQEWLGKGRWDVIHFNWGLHDLKIMEGGRHQAEVDEYETNLKELVKQLKDTGAKLIWASTTPVPEGKLDPPRRPADVPIYNAAAKNIMDANGIAIDDLYEFVVPRESEIQQKENVHYTSAGYQALAARVAEAVQLALPAN
ncbi:MAG: SGNH/GDSL hydrolase family protein [Bryobacteraceae bacterium]